MHFLSLLVYRVVVRLYAFSARLISPFNDKARQWVDGRKNIWEEIEKARFSGLPVWFHCASLGEFEQALPLIEKLKIDNEIALTFFSPSGYEFVKRKYPELKVFYLPVDTPGNARTFIQLIQPGKAIFTRYDLWYFFLAQLKQHKIPTFLIAAVFRKEQIFFKWYGSLFREMLNTFSHVFVQDDKSKNVLLNHGFKNVAIAGDTRVDRVVAITKNAEHVPFITQFKGSKKLLVVGSLEPKDEKVVLPVLLENHPGVNFKIIIAPHRVEPDSIHQLLNKLKSKTCLKFSEAGKNAPEQFDILIIDKVGLLSRIYADANVAYIGGGFGEGLHNTLEPAAWGVPLLFGPRYHKFIEAVEMVKNGGATIVQNENDCRINLRQLLSDESAGRTAGRKTKEYIETNAGATSNILHHINSTYSTPNP